MIILVGGEKGGSGKSCLAQNLAVYLQQKNRDILLLDADPQGTTTDWIKERDENLDLQNIPSVQAAGNIRQVLDDLSKRYQDIIIDAGGQDSEALRSAMTIATHMLLPFRPKRRDLKTLVHVEQLIKLAKAVNPSLISRAVITQCPTLPSQVQRILDAKEACESFNLQPLQQFTTNRNVYDDADENGLSVFEVDTDKKAVIEIEQLALEFLGRTLMALKGLTKVAQETKSTDQRIEEFINGSSKRIKNLEVSQQVYRRYTFSLTEDVSNEIDNLLIECKVAKANRSIILKTALHQLQKLSPEELQRVVIEELK